MSNTRSRRWLAPSFFVLLTAGAVLATSTGCASAPDAAVGAESEDELVSKKSVTVVGPIESLGYDEYVDKALKKYRAYSFEAEPNTGFIATVSGTRPEVTIVDSAFATVATGATKDGTASASAFLKASGTYYVVFRDLAPAANLRPSVRVARDLTKATQSKFSCTTRKALGDEVEKLAFTTVFMDRADIATDVVPINEDDGMYFAATPDDGYLAALNENTTFQLEGNEMRVHGDSDGFFLIDLVLYKDSGFAKGYAKLRDLGEGTGDAYSEVDCKVATKAAK